MKHKLINLQTKEEHLCDKVTIDGFDYYIVDKEPFPYAYIKHKNEVVKVNGIGEESGEVFHEKGFNYKHECEGIIATNNPNIDIPQVVDEFEYDYDNLGESMITDALLAFEKRHGYLLQTKEARDLRFKETGKGGDYLYYSHYEVDDNFVYLHYEEYTNHDQPYWVTLELPLKSSTYPKLKKSQETQLFSEEDMIDFYEWCDTSEESVVFWRRNKVDPDMGGNHWKKIRKNREKLLQLWKEQQPKIVWYE